MLLAVNLEVELVETFLGQVGNIGLYRCQRRNQGVALTVFYLPG